MTVLLKYAVTGSTLNPTTTASGASGSALANGSLYSFTVASQGYASDPEAKAGATSSGANMATALASNSYFYFTVTPDSGKHLDLTSLGFNCAAGTSVGVRGWGIRSSVDAYASTIATAVCATVRTTWGAVSVDLTGASFQGLTGAVTFRVYVYATTSTNTAEFDDITLNGAVATGATSYPATGQADASTAISGAATVKRKATGATAGAVVTGLSGGAPKVKRTATGTVGAVTGLSGTAFRRYAATATVAATTTAAATPTTKRAATGSSAVASGLNGTATAKHPTTGIAGAVTTGTSGTATVKRLAGTAAPINVVTTLSGAATVTTMAPGGKLYSTGRTNAVTGLSGRANVTRAATGSVSSVTGAAGVALAKYGVTGSVSTATGASGAATAILLASGLVEIVTEVSGTPRGGAVKYPATGLVNVVTQLYYHTSPAYVPVSGDRVPSQPRNWPLARSRRPVVDTPAAPGKWYRRMR